MARPKKMGDGRNVRTAGEAAAEVAGARPEATRRVGRPVVRDAAGNPLTTTTYRVSPPIQRRLRYLALDLDTDASILVREALEAYMPELEKRAAEAKKEKAAAEKKAATGAR